MYFNYVVHYLATCQKALLPIIKVWIIPLLISVVSFLIHHLQGYTLLATLLNLAAEILPSDVARRMPSELPRYHSTLMAQHASIVLVTQKELGVLFMLY